MARIHNLRDTEDKELRNEYLLANAKVKDWFGFSTGCSKQYSLQQATFVLVDKLRNSIGKFYRVTNVGCVAKFVFVLNLIKNEGCS